MDNIVREIPTLICLTLVCLMIYGILRSMKQDRKKGKHLCSGNCGCCGLCKALKEKNETH